MVGRWFRHIAGDKDWVVREEAGHGRDLANVAVDPGRPRCLSGPDNDVVAALLYPQYPYPEYLGFPTLIERSLCG